MGRPYKKLNGKRAWRPYQKRKRVALTESDLSRETPQGEGPSNKRVQWQGSTTEETEGNAKYDHPTTSEMDENYEIADKVILVAVSMHGQTACAYYDPIKCRIYVMEDTQETAHYDLTRSVLEQSSPDICLTSTKSDDAFTDILRAHMEMTKGFFQIRPYKEFDTNRARERILSLRILTEFAQIEQDNVNRAGTSSDTGSTTRNASDFMRSNQQTAHEDPTTQRWHAAIRLNNFTSSDSSGCIGTVGALLDHLVRENAIHDPENEGIRSLEVRDIETLALSQVMQINADALSSLQIFEDEKHASVHSDRTKEGLSLFGILNNTQTTLGRSLLRAWLLRPSLSLSVIKARHDAVSCFTDPANLVVADGMHRHLKGVKNVPRILSMMKSGRAKIGDWQGLIKFTFHAVMIKDALTELFGAKDVEIVNKLMAALDVSCFKEIGQLVNDTLDWEESSTAGRMCIRPHIDEELDNRKHVFNGIDSILSSVAQTVSQTIPEGYTTSLNVVYFPQLGFLICVPMLDEWHTASGIQVLDEWSFQFSSESHVYFKSKEMQDLDVHIGDLLPLIVDREIELIQALVDQILEHEPLINHACDIFAELDCLLSFGEASTSYNYRRPIMVEDNMIKIVQGRHPLQEQVVDTFVSNDASIIGGSGVGVIPGPEDEGGTSILLCTGANACGKSVYLKQIALIQYMAQIGCFVPAASAVLGITDKIFTRVSTRESVSKIQSAFMIDLNQVSLALRNATPRSLVLLDEFGKGTLSTDGAGLFCGVIKHLLERGEFCPKVLAATHFHDVFKPDMLDPEALPFTPVHMQIIFSTAGDHHAIEQPSSRLSTSIVRPQDKITYLYRVAPGLSLASHAAQCAEIFGVPARVVDRARYVSALISEHELGKLLDEDMTEEEGKELRNAEAVFKRFVEWNVEQDTGVEHVHDKLRWVMGISEI